MDLEVICNQQRSFEVLSGGLGEIFDLSTLFSPHQGYVTV